MVVVDGWLCYYMLIQKGHYVMKDKKTAAELENLIAGDLAAEYGRISIRVCRQGQDWNAIPSTSGFLPRFEEVRDHYRSLYDLA